MAETTKHVMTNLTVANMYLPHKKKKKRENEHILFEFLY